MAHFIRILGVLLLAAFASPAAADDSAGAVPPGQALVRLSASLADKGDPLNAGLRWRLFRAVADPDGTHALVTESTMSQPALPLPAGDYVVHVAFGLASASKQISVGDQPINLRLALNAGGLKISGTLGDSAIPPNRLSVAVYVPQKNDPEGKLVYAKNHTGEVIGLPEGPYHVVSTYLDTVGVGSLGVGKDGGGAPSSASPTNSIVAADIKVVAGKVIDATMRHRAATLTLKLVNAPGAEALANSSFTILTPGGDLIRELIGAFPSLVLAEGDYVVIARHNEKTYQSTFQVRSALDRDVEVIAQ